MKNHFAEPWVGERYAEARPDIHGVVADEIARHVGYVGHALDLGCGTGLSTRALSSHAARVVGLDPSVGMLLAASPVSSGSFTRGRAELLPFREGSFELVTIGCAYHWCEREKLFEEVARVLSRDGWFAIFDSEFMGLVDSPGLLEWLQNDYWAGLPRCPRYELFDAASHLQPPFVLVSCVSPEAHVPMTVEDVLLLITTQASTVNAVTSGTAPLAELECRLREGIRGSFPEGCERAPARFVNPLWLLRKSA
jgi:SAM-dependent methyltransferase